MKIAVLDTCTITKGDVALDEISALGEVSYYDDIDISEVSEKIGDADAIIIALGTNDQANVATDGVINEDGAQTYLDSMRRLIEGYHAAYPNAIIYITTALPRWTSEASTANTYNVVIPLQQQLAGEYSYTKLMDLYSDMKPYADIDETNNT